MSKNHIWEPCKSAPAEITAGEAISQLKRKPDGYWTYLNPDQSIHHIELRYDRCDRTGEKDFYPYTYGVLDGQLGWHMKEPHKPRPIYSLAKLGDDLSVPVLLVEGAKTADAAQARFPDYKVTTTSGGAGVPRLSDFTPLKDRSVIIWPDNDKAGLEYAEKSAKILREVGAKSVAQVQVPNHFPAKWDLADEVPDRTVDDDADVLRTLLECAVVVHDNKWHESLLVPEEGASFSNVPDIDPKHYGSAGEIVAKIFPFTEAGFLPLLVQLLIFTAHVVGRKPHWSLSGPKHFLNQFVILLGPTSTGRKGTSTAVIKSIFQQIYPDFCDKHILRGLNSGEGLIHHMKESNASCEASLGSERCFNGRSCIIIEEEFVNVFKVSRRDSNTLTGNLRNLWDGTTLQTLVRNNPAIARDPFGSLIAHITLQEFKDHLDLSDIRNGVLNRFIFLNSQMSKFLPFGGSMPEAILASIRQQLIEIIDFSRKIGEMSFTSHGVSCWEDIYLRSFSAGDTDLADITARQIPILRRLACSFALFDRQQHVDVPHIEAALRITEHSSEVCNQFLNDLPNKHHKAAKWKLLVAIKSSNGGLTRDQILKDVFQKNKDAASIQRLLQELETERTITRDDSCLPPKWKVQPSIANKVYQDPFMIRPDDVTTLRPNDVTPKSPGQDKNLEILEDLT